MKPALGVLLGALVCASCHGPVRRSGSIGTDAARYRFSNADLQIDLEIRTDGSYYARMDCWARVTDEAGVWSRKGDRIALEARSGKLQFPIRQLGPVSPDNANSCQIVDPDIEITRAVILQRTDL